MTKPRHFLTLNDLSSDECLALLKRGAELKSSLRAGEIYHPLKDKVLAMIFEKPSTRTRVSFETGMIQFGGHAIFLSRSDTQLARDETIEDTARVLSEMVDAVMIRTFEHSAIERMAQYARVPIINGLSNSYHPCQLLADMLTYYEKRGSIRNKIVAWLGDSNNMCHSYINAARLYDFHLRIATPCSDPHETASAENASGRVEYCRDARAAVQDAALVVTDTWSSMGQERERRLDDFMPYQVTADLMTAAREDALFMHCLPAHRGEEVTAEVLEGEQSVVWEQAGNRLHAQKALLEFLMT